MNNKGVGYIECFLIGVILALLYIYYGPVQADAAPREMYLTCYCPESCPGTITASGQTVREGIAAVGNSETFRKVATIWTQEGELLGFWECLDRIGKPTDSVIDIWMPDIEQSKEMMELTGGRVIVEFTE